MKKILRFLNVKNEKYTIEFAKSVNVKNNVENNLTTEQRIVIKEINNNIIKKLKY